MGSTLSPVLEALPVEILEHVVSLLELKDICSLRLVSQGAAGKSSRGVFRKYFLTKSVKLNSTEELSRLAYFTQLGRLGCLVQRLTLVGVVVSAAKLDNFPEKLLAQAFSNLRTNTPHQSLKTLILFVQGEAEDGGAVPCERIKDWKKVWNVAAQTLAFASRALAESGLIVEQFDIFSAVPRCSLACNCIGPLLDSTGLSRSVASLKRLSLNLSHHIAGDGNADSLGSLAAGHTHADNVLQLLTLFPQLEVLDLRWYKLVAVNPNSAQIEESRILDRLLQLEQILHLRDCRLRGFTTDENTLLSLLKKMAQIQKLSLEHIRLESGRFGPVFDHLCHQFPPLEYLHFNSLSESRLVCFDAPGEPHYKTLYTTTGPNQLTLRKEDGPHNIRYNLMQGRPLGDPSVLKYTNLTRDLYGPPDTGLSKPRKYYLM